MKNRSNDRRLFRWTAVAGWAGTIFYLSSRSTMPVAPPFPGFDKLVHAFEYGVLCILVARAISGNKTGRTENRAWIISILLCLLYGILDEAHQAFVPNRSCDSLDAFSDLAGAIISALPFFRFRSGKGRS